MTPLALDAGGRCCEREHLNLGSSSSRSSRLTPASHLDAVLEGSSRLAVVNGEEAPIEGGWGAEIICPDRAHSATLRLGSAYSYIAGLRCKKRSHPTRAL